MKGRISALSSRSRFSPSVNTCSGIRSVCRSNSANQSSSFNSAVLKVWATPYFTNERSEGKDLSPLRHPTCHPTLTPNPHSAHFPHEPPFNFRSRIAGLRPQSIPRFDRSRTRPREPRVSLFCVEQFPHAQRPIFCPQPLSGAKNRPQFLEP